MIDGRPMATASAPSPRCALDLRQRAGRPARRSTPSRVGTGSNVSKLAVLEHGRGDLRAADVDPDEAPVAHGSQLRRGRLVEHQRQRARARAHVRGGRGLVRRRRRTRAAPPPPCRRRRRGTRPRARVLSSGKVSVTRGTCGSIPASGTPTASRWRLAAARACRGTATRCGRPGPRPSSDEVEPRVVAERLAQQRLVGGGRGVGPELGLDRASAAGGAPRAARSVSAARTIRSVGALVVRAARRARRPATASRRSGRRRVSAASS